MLTVKFAYSLGNIIPALHWALLKVRIAPRPRRPRRHRLVALVALVAAASTRIARRVRSLRSPGD